MYSNRLKRINQHCLRSKRGLQRGGDDRAVPRGKGDRRVAGRHEVPLAGKLNGLCKAMLGAEHD